MAGIIESIWKKLRRWRARTTVPTKTVYLDIISEHNCVAMVRTVRGRSLRGEVVKLRSGVYTYRIDAQSDETIYSGERYVFWSPIGEKTASFYDNPCKALEEIYRIFEELYKPHKTKNALSRIYGTKR